MNLLRVERTIASYHVSDKDIVNEINIDYVPFDKILSIIDPHEDDPLLYDGYVLSEDQFDLLNSLLEEKILPNFEDFYYVLECAGIYE
ncbi:MAG TPA: hypothetical protein VGO21_01545 [Candidatus Paceibacterota bacterium]|nr:hypothetical protein [Candidatus Paceibacterota bacterium]